MRRLIVIVFMTGIFSCAFASTLDLNPPSWRGSPYSTMQQWEFPADDPEPYATSWDNPFGPMHISLLGSWSMEYDIPYEDWLMNYDLFAAWKWESTGGPLLSIRTDTNWPGTATDKLARVQVTWGVNFHGANPPYYEGGMIYVSNNGLDGIFPSGWFINTQTLGTTDSIEWYHTTYELSFSWGDLIYDEFGNVIDIISGEIPSWLDLELYPDHPIFNPDPLTYNYTIYVAEMVVDTICVPEPVTILLLGIGGIALLRKR